jgi:hypothetical protein
MKRALRPVSVTDDSATKRIATDLKKAFPLHQARKIKHLKSEYAKLQTRMASLKREIDTTSTPVTSSVIVVLDIVRTDDIRSLVDGQYKSVADWLSTKFSRWSFYGYHIVNQRTSLYYEVLETQYSDALLEQLNQGLKGKAFSCCFVNESDPRYREPLEALRIRSSTPEEVERIFNNAYDFEFWYSTQISQDQDLSCDLQITRFLRSLDQMMDSEFWYASIQNGDMGVNNSDVKRSTLIRIMLTTTRSQESPSQSTDFDALVSRRQLIQKKANEIFKPNFDIVLNHQQ